MLLREIEQLKAGQTVYPKGMYDRHGNPKAARVAHMSSLDIMKRPRVAPDGVYVPLTMGWARGYITSKNRDDFSLSKPANR